MRADGREENQIRKVQIKRNYLKYASGSCQIVMGDTKVICSATVEDGVPKFLKNQGRGWVTAEYSMLPASCMERIQRESMKGRPSGRTQEIQRLIGRSLRAVVNMPLLGERTIILDADVIQGDGGTRTASVTGCYIALAEAVEKLIAKGKITQSPIIDYVAAISVGRVGGITMIDLNYGEDSKAEVDMNVVMTGSGKFIEIQGTAEKVPFGKKEMDKMLGMAAKGIKQLVQVQKKIITI